MYLLNLSICLRVFVHGSLCLIALDKEWNDAKAHLRFKEGRKDPQSVLWVDASESFCHAASLGLKKVMNYVLVSLVVLKRLIPRYLNQLTIGIPIILSSWF